MSKPPGYRVGRELRSDFLPRASWQAEIYRRRRARPEAAIVVPPISSSWGSLSATSASRPNAFRIPPNPEEPIGARQPRARRTGALQKQELVAQRKNLELQCRSRADRLPAVGQSLPTALLGVRGSSGKRAPPWCAEVARWVPART